MKTENDIGDLIDQAHGIIKEALDSSDEYTRTKAALDLLQPLTIFVLSRQVSAAEKWEGEIKPPAGVQRQQPPQRQEGGDRDK